MMVLATIAALLRRVPKPVWFVGSTVAAFLLLARWHEAKVEAAYSAGAATQAQADDQRVKAASSAAAAAQQSL